MNPDRIIVGEVRGGEAEALIRAWNTGPPRRVATLHCSSAHAALGKLRRIRRRRGCRRQTARIAEAVDLVAFIERAANRRVLSELLLVKGFANDDYLTEVISKENVHVVA